MYHKGNIIFITFVILFVLQISVISGYNVTLKFKCIKHDLEIFLLINLVFN